MMNGSLVNFGYEDTKSNFDTPESQGVMNHIINSIKFFNSDDSSNSSGDNNEEESNDDSDNDNNG